MQDKVQNKNWNTHVQREVQLSSTYFSMMEKVQKQKSVEIQRDFNTTPKIQIRKYNTGIYNQKKQHTCIKKI